MEKTKEEVVDNINQPIGHISDEKHDEFHDAIDRDDGGFASLEAKFEDAITLEDDDDDEKKPVAEVVEEKEEVLTEEEKQERKIKCDALKQEGNAVYKSADYDKSIELYTEALTICPKSFASERSILYANRGAAYIQKELKDLAIADCTKSLELNDKYVKALIRRAKLYEDTDKLDESLTDYTRILELDPSYVEARAVIPRLNQKIEERNEKMKTEMLGKLKDLGNLILKPFGLSTQNFQMQQDPSTGSYSVNFNQKPEN